MSNNKMKQLKICDVESVYSINCEYDLYIMYTDFLIDTDACSPDYEIIEMIRDEYYLIYDEIEEGSYSLIEFERRALQIIGFGY